jgi:hypothetical protein
MAASQKLSHLLQLADQGPALRAALAEEVTELLAAWPSDYPQSVRLVCEALLAKATRDMTTTNNANQEAGLQSVIEAARKGGDVTVPLARSLHVDAGKAERILGDASGSALALACKSAGIDRAAFSALVLLLWPQRDRNHAFTVLDAFDKAAA